MTRAPNISIRKIKEWEPSEIIALYKDAGWWKDHFPKEEVPSLIKGSFLFAVAVNEDGHAVGMGRVISDGVSDGYIQDLAVLKDYQSMGIGRKIVRFLLEECISSGLSWVGLFSEPGTEGFYEILGFDFKPDYNLMIYEGEE